MKYTQRPLISFALVIVASFLFAGAVQATVSYRGVDSGMSSESFTETFGNSTYIDEQNTTAEIYETNSYARILYVLKTQVSPSIDYSMADQSTQVAWLGAGGIYMQRFDIDGNPIWGEDAFVGPGSGGGVDTLAMSTYPWQGRSASTLVAFRNAVSRTVTIGNRDRTLTTYDLRLQEMREFQQQGRRHYPFYSSYSGDDWSMDNGDLLFSTQPDNGNAGSVRMDSFGPAGLGTRTWAVWVDASGVRLQRLKMGASFVEPTDSRIVVISASGYNPDVAVDMDGNAYVVWDEWNGGESIYYTYLQKYYENGALAWAQPKVLGKGGRPRIDFDPSGMGSVSVVGTRYSIPGSRDWEIPLWVRDLDGNEFVGMWDSEYVVASGIDPTGLSAPNPTVAVNKNANAGGDSTVYIAWYDIARQKIQIQGARYYSIGGEIICSFGPTCPAFKSEIGPTMPAEMSPGQPKFDFVQSGWEPQTDDPLGGQFLYLAWHEIKNNDSDIYLQKWEVPEGTEIWKIQANRPDSINTAEAVIQSLTRDTLTENILRATLTVVEDTPIGTRIDYYLSVNGGTVWEEVTPGQEHVLVTAGSDLRWRAVMFTVDDTQTPTLYDLTVSYSAEALTDTTPPEAPLFDAAIDGGHPPTNIAIPFITVPADAAYLRLYRSTTPGVLGSIIYSNLPASNGGFIFYLADAGLQWDTTYYFTLRAVDAAGNESTNTLQKSVTLPQDPINEVPSPEGVPPAPEYTANIGHIGGEPTSMVFAYSSVPDEAVYLRLYRSTVAGQLGSVMYQTLSASSNGFGFGIIEAGLDWGQTYYFTLRAVSSSGQESTNISTTPTIIPADPGITTSPTDVTITVTSPKNGSFIRYGDTLLIEWTADGITSAHQQLVFAVTIMDAKGEAVIKPVTNSVPGNVRYFAWQIPDGFAQGIFRVKVGAIWILNGATTQAATSQYDPYFVIDDSAPQDVTPVDDSDPNKEGCLPNGTLVKPPNDTKIYVIKDCQKLWIRSANEFTSAGYAWEDVQDVAEDIILLHPELAKVISQLLRFSDSPDIFVLRDGQLHRIPDAGTLAARRLRWEDVNVVDRSTMQGVSRGFDFMPEGAIMRAKGTLDVYIIKYMGDKQFRRLILNPSVFRSYGHLRWEDVRDVEQATVDVFPEANLVRVAGTNQIYRLTPNGDVGVRQRISDAKLAAMGLDAESVYEINAVDQGSYTEGESLE